LPRRSHIDLNSADEIDLASRKMRGQPRAQIKILNPNTAASVAPQYFFGGSPPESDDQQRRPQS